MNGVFDARQVRRAFSRAAESYESAAALQREVESRLLESLDYLGDREPAVVLDIGCGPAHAALALQRRWPRAQVLAFDLALPMLRHARERFAARPLRERLPWARTPALACADARALPLPDASVDVLFSNLCVQWIEDLPALFAGFRRVLKPDGLLLLSTFGTDTLVELREAFAHADEAPHVSPFASIAQFGDALMSAGFRDPVLDRDVFELAHPDLASLMRELRALGATNALTTRRRSLTGRARFARAEAAYATMRTPEGQLPVTWEVIYAHAWGPPPGAPIRIGGVDEVRVPVSSLRVRRR
ncbi:MAG TPA: malonyl-ACP O-methyltransferase BioC [Lysobacter sp.]|nr:malonyl-ACP O-methyltransferase BioC [Lysobacter sp.]